MLVWGNENHSIRESYRGKVSWSLKDESVIPRQKHLSGQKQANKHTSENLSKGKEMRWHMREKRIVWFVTK